MKGIRSFMKVLGKPEVFFLLKSHLDRAGYPVVRFAMVDADWNGPVFSLKFSDQTDGDIFVDEQGIRFVAEKKFAPAMDEGIELIRTGDEGVSIKKKPCWY